MSENMSISVNGQSQVPPGFRFHPTEEELLQYYLRKKVGYEKIDLDVIRDVDLNKLEPWDIQETCKIGSTPQNDWYFFSHKDKKYPTGTRTNRATAAGFWKATGRDKVIYSNSRRIGMRKTLVFYKGRAPHGQKSDWIMHEYRLDDSTGDTNNFHDLQVYNNTTVGETTQEEGWVVCRIFKKKNHLNKTLNSHHAISAERRSQRPMNSSDEGILGLEQILDQYMGGRRPPYSNEGNEANITNNGSRFLQPIELDADAEGDADAAAINNGSLFMKLPSLHSPNSTGSQTCYQPIFQADCAPHVEKEAGLKGWAALDRLVASHLNGQISLEDPTVAMASFCYPATDLDLERLRSSSSSSSISNSNNGHDFAGSEFHLWSSFGRSSSLSSADPFCHVSNAHM